MMKACLSDGLFCFWLTLTNKYMGIVTYQHIDLTHGIQYRLYNNFCNNRPNCEEKGSLHRSWDAIQSSLSSY